MSFHIETSFGSVNKVNEELCGDKVEVARTEKETILVLSDGLGSGVKANILATLTSKIIITMLCEEAEISDVVETLATTLPVCQERKVAYSTFTIFRINNETGRVNLVEYDSPDTILLRKGELAYIFKEEKEIAGKKIRMATMDLQPEDMLITFSDGAIHAGVGKLLNFGWQQENIEKYVVEAYEHNTTAMRMQKMLLGACNNLYMDCPGDDTTVAACRICLPDIAHIMVGPPVSKEDDKEAVDLLMSTTGKKIVCGGTTSQIVSKALGKELEVDLRYINQDVPPIGKIEGIDLATEGVITLGKTLEDIRRYTSGELGAENKLASQDDGAALVAKILLEQCTGAKFIVGRALNPAHQNPNLPINLNIKLGIVEDIAEELRKIGKDVEVIYL